MPKPTSFQPCYSSSIAPNPYNQGSTIKITLIIYTLAHACTQKFRNSVRELEGEGLRITSLFVCFLVNSGDPRP